MLMKKLIVISIIVFISICSYGQNDSLQQISKPKVEYYLVIDKTTIIQFDSLNTDVSDLKWIKKIAVVRDEKTKHIYGNTGGKIFIYPKKRFRNKLLENYKRD